MTGCHMDYQLMWIFNDVFHLACLHLGWPRIVRLLFWSSFFFFPVSCLCHPVHKATQLVRISLFLATNMSPGIFQGCLLGSVFNGKLLFCYERLKYSCCVVNGIISFFAWLLCSVYHVSFVFQSEKGRLFSLYRFFLSVLCLVCRNEVHNCC